MPFSPVGVSRFQGEGLPAFRWDSGIRLRLGWAHAYPKNPSAFGKHEGRHVHAEAQAWCVGSRAVGGFILSLD